MTWVVGVSTIFGYGALYSDIQVTYSGGGSTDVLQKAYPLSNFIAAGFAGSVRIGFMLLQSLSDFLRIPDDALSKLAWDPVWVVHNWAPNCPVGVPECTGCREAAWIAGLDSWCLTDRELWLGREGLLYSLFVAAIQSRSHESRDQDL